MLKTEMDDVVMRSSEMIGCTLAEAIVISWVINRNIISSLSKIKMTTKYNSHIFMYDGIL